MKRTTASSVIFNSLGFITLCPEPCFSWNNGNLYNEWCRFKSHAVSFFEGPLYDKEDSVKIAFFKLWIGDEGRFLFEKFISCNTGTEINIDLSLLLSRYDEYFLTNQYKSNIEDKSKAVCNNGPIQRIRCDDPSQNLSARPTCLFSVSKDLQSSKLSNSHMSGDSCSLPGSNKAVSGLADNVKDIHNQSNEMEWIKPRVITNKESAFHQNRKCQHCSSYSMSTLFFKNVKKQPSGQSLLKIHSSCLKTDVFNKTASDQFEQIRGDERTERILEQSIMSDSHRGVEQNSRGEYYDLHSRSVPQDYQTARVMDPDELPMSPTSAANEHEETNVKTLSDGTMTQSENAGIPATQPAPQASSSTGDVDGLELLVNDLTERDDWPYEIFEYLNSLPRDIGYNWESFLAWNRVTAVQIHQFSKDKASFEAILSKCPPFDHYTIGDLIKTLRNMGCNDEIRRIQSIVRRQVLTGQVQECVERTQAQAEPQEPQGACSNPGLPPEEIDERPHCLVPVSLNDESNIRSWPFEVFKILNTHLSHNRYNNWRTFLGNEGFKKFDIDTFDISPKERLMQHVLFSDCHCRKFPAYDMVQLKDTLLKMKLKIAIKELNNEIIRQNSLGL